jgi:hypothetical protein
VQRPNSRRAGSAQHTLSAGAHISRLYVSEIGFSDLDIIWNLGIGFRERFGAIRVRVD